MEHTARTDLATYKQRPLLGSSPIVSLVGRPSLCSRQGTERVAVAACAMCKSDQSGQMTQHLDLASRYHLTLDPRFLRTSCALAKVLQNPHRPCRRRHGNQSVLVMIYAIAIPLTNASETTQDWTRALCHEVPGQNFVQRPAGVQESVHRAGVPASVIVGHELCLTDFNYADARLRHELPSLPV